MKQKLEPHELRIGMYVCDLDRPWLESPFLFQGFLIEDTKIIDELTDYCDYIYIDTERGDAKQTPAAEPARTFNPAEKTIPNTPRSYNVRFEDEIGPARSLREKTEQYMQQLFKDLRAGKSISSTEIQHLVGGMVSSILRNPDALVLLSTLREHDEYAVAHSINVCTLCLAFGRYLGMPAEALTELGIGALLHDVGEVRLPVELLHKTGLLSNSETQLMRTHTKHGADILRKNKDLPPTSIEIALSHHERSNGQGYPNGLTENDISQYAKIVGLIDVYDSVTTAKLHGHCITSTEALKNMYNWRNDLFDGHLIEEFIQCLGIYPVGSIVELNTGEVGIVISVGPENRLQPKLMLVRDEAKKPYTPPRIINLANYSRREHKHQYEINKVLETGDYGIDLKSYLLREIPLDMEFDNAS